MNFCKIITGLSPIYLQEDFHLFQKTTTINLREGAGRDERMFDVTLAQRKKPTTETHIAVEWNGLPLQLRKEKF